MPYLLLVLATLFWSGNLILSKGMHTVLGPLTLSFWRWLLAFILLAPFAWPHCWRQRDLIRAHLGFLALQGFLGVSAFNVLLYVAMHYTSAINAVLVNSSTPVLIIVFSWLLHGETMRLKQTLGVLLSLGGVLLILAQGDVAAVIHISFNLGDILIFASAAVWALYSANLRRLPQELHPQAYLLSINALGLAGLTPLYAFALARGEGLPQSWPAILTLVYMALFSSVLAFLFWNSAVQRIGANRAGPFIHLMPVFSILLAILFLKERFFWYQAQGMALVFVGIVLANLGDRLPQLRAKP